MTHEHPRPGSRRLAASLKRLRDAGPGSPPALDLEPSNAFEVAVAEQIKAMRQDLDRLESRLWWLFALVVAAAATDILAGLFS